jgi:hypothetical protein
MTSASRARGFGPHGMQQKRPTTHIVKRAFTDKRLNPMIDFKCTIGDCYGWATLFIETPDRQVKILCSNLIDSLGDWVRAFAELTSRDGRAEVACYNEPGENLVKLRRNGDELEIVITRFRDEFDGVPDDLADKVMSGSPRAQRRIDKRRNKKAVLRYHCSFAEATKRFHAAFASALSEIGPEHYQATWGHSLPKEALETVRAYTQETDGR